MFRRFIAVIFFIIILLFLIAYSRGYRLDFQNKSFNATGILALSSSPKPAKIYINGELKGVTDTNVTLPPGDYTIDIKKDGYSDWSKKVKLKGELVMSYDVVLFPRNPSLSSLTNLG